MLAQQAEELGYLRVWYAEHHNMPRIAFFATSAPIAHIGAQTRSIRLGAGGVMPPNHAPLLIAEQFAPAALTRGGSTSAWAGRRARIRTRCTRCAATRARPTPSRRTSWSCRATSPATSVVPGVNAVPGNGSHVPLYILGPSLFGASLAAALGLPYAFASHFAPAALEEALAVYRREFRPSGQLERPYAIAGVNVIAADSDSDAREQLQGIRERGPSACTGAGARARTQST